MVIRVLRLWRWREIPALVRTTRSKMNLRGLSRTGSFAASWRLTYLWNLAGVPAISLPCGFDRQGLPIGLQLAARPFDELTIIRAADFYERAHDWKDHRPTL